MPIKTIIRCHLSPSGWLLPTNQPTNPLTYNECWAGHGMRMGVAGRLAGQQLCLKQLLAKQAPSGAGADRPARCPRVSPIVSPGPQLELGFLTG